MRVLITGMNGFAGSHLADHLLTQPDIELVGAGLGNRDNLAPLGERAAVISGDLTDAGFAKELLARTKPDQIYHLAAQAFPPESWQDPWGTLEVNVRGQVNLLQAAAEMKLNARILIVGSMDQYGRIEPGALPLTETTPFCPNSPYAVSKIAQDFLGLQYYLSHRLQIVRVRPANHIGPRQKAQFVTSNFAKQIAEAEADIRAPVIYVGNLSAERDFTDVRDMARAYALALERGEPGEVYCIGSDRAVSIRSMLEMLLKQSRVQMRVEEDPARLRPSDSPTMYYDSRKFRRLTGWQPRISLEQSLKDVLDYWREKIKTQSTVGVTP